MNSPASEWKGILASILLAKTAVATFSIAPFLVGGYIDHLNFSAAEAGRMLSVEIFALAFSNAIAFFWIHKVSCRKWAQRLLVLVVACNILCIYAPGYSSLLTLRVATGALEGALLALGFGLLGKTRRPNRNFGLYFAVSLTIGAINVRILPLFLEAAGVAGLFVNLSLYAIIALAGSIWVQERRVADLTAADAAIASNSGGFAIAAVPLAFLIVANYVYFVGQGGVWSFLERLGLQQGIDLAGIASALSLSLIAGVAGGATAGWLDLKLGRVWPLIAAMTFALLSIGLLFGFPGALGYTLAACLFNYGNNLGHPYVLGFAAELDESSRLTVLSGALHTAGQATGPLIAGLIVTSNNYTNVLWLGSAAFLATMLLFLPVITAMRK